MSKSTVVGLPGPVGSEDALTERVRSGARQLIHPAMEVELQGYRQVVERRAL